MSTDTTVYAWGCVIIHDGIEHNFSGHCLQHRALRNGEFYALIKALECLSLFKTKRAKVYTEEASVVANFKAFKDGKALNLKGRYSRYFKWLLEFTNNYNLNIVKIPRNQNVAHDLANGELINAQRNLLDVKPFVVPDCLAPPVIRSTKKNKKPRSPHSIIKSCIPQQLRSKGNFNTHLLRSLEQCVNNEDFHNLLLAQGVNVSSFYQMLKNKFPKRIMYKEDGEKKLHISFAKALLNSEFCVCEIDGLFYVFYYDYRPESANIIDYNLTKTASSSYLCPIIDDVLDI